MKGDFTRDTFDPTHHHQQVRLQQGRVLVDADFNEQSSISARRAETIARDVIGPCGGPAEHAAFRVFTNPNELSQAEEARLGDSLPLAAGDFFLDAGRYYVDGVQCESEFAIPYTRQPHRCNVQPLKTGECYLLYLDVWRRHITAMETPALRESALGGPDTATRVQTVWQARALKVKRDYDTLPDCAVAHKHLRTLADPNTARLTADTSAPPDLVGPCELPPSAGYFGLENQLYRVEIHDPGDALANADVSKAFPVLLSAEVEKPCEVAVEGGHWKEHQAVELFAGNNGVPMRGRLFWIKDVNGGKLTLSWPVVGLQQADNPRIRPVGAAWKWSRENGAVVTRISKINGPVLKVADLGPDSNLGFREGDVVELFDDRHELEGELGRIARVRAVDPISSSITLWSDEADLIEGTQGNWNPRLRRWEGVAAVRYASDANGDWMEMENGIRVRFGRDGEYRTGHYWQIPARAATARATAGDIDWPFAQSDRLPLPPRGVHHHYACIGIASIASDGDMTLRDCRCLHLPVSSLPRVFYLGGDGQSAPPPVAPAGLVRLPQLLRVGAGNRHCAAPEAKVRFQVVLGNGQVSAVGGAPSGSAVDVPLNEAGEAACEFHLQAAGWRNATDVAAPPLVQRVEAALLDGSDQRVTPTISFSATLAVARAVAFDPGECRALAVRSNVQEAISHLAALNRMSLHGGDGQDALPGGALPRPLQVLVASACGPLPSVRVRFKAEADGRVAGAEPDLPTSTSNSIEVATNGNGIGQCWWKLDPDPNRTTQQLRAEILGEDEIAIGHPRVLSFTANLRRANDVDSCCFSVGKGGKFGSLEEAIKETLDRQTNICLRLLPGDHSLPNGLKVFSQWEDRRVHLVIHGCGAGARVVSNGPIEAGTLGSLTLRDMEVSFEGLSGDAMVVSGCGTLRLERCRLRVRDTLATLLHAVKVDNVEVRDSVLESWFYYWDKKTDPLDIRSIQGLAFPADAGHATTASIAARSNEIAEMLLKASGPNADLMRRFADRWSDASVGFWKKLSPDRKIAVSQAAESVRKNIQKRVELMSAMQRLAFGVVLALDGASTQLTLEHTEVVGEVRFLGNTTAMEFGLVREFVDVFKTPIPVDGDRPVWRILDCQVWRLTFDSSVVALLEEARNKKRIRAIPGMIWCGENAIVGDECAFLGDQMSLSANRFTTASDALAVALGNGGSCIGNHAEFGKKFVANGCGQFVPMENPPLNVNITIRPA